MGDEGAGAGARGGDFHSAAWHQQRVAQLLEGPRETFGEYEVRARAEARERALEEATRDEAHAEYLRACARDRERRLGGGAGAGTGAGGREGRRPGAPRGRSILIWEPGQKPGRPAPHGQGAGGRRPGGAACARRCSRRVGGGQ